jgi:hypothetical protein
MAQKGAAQGRNRDPKRTEVIWKTQPDAVKAEINRLQKENPTKMLLGLRQTALSNILGDLPQGERIALDAEVKRIGREGNLEKDKRR